MFFLIVHTLVHTIQKIFQTLCHYSWVNTAIFGYTFDVNNFDLSFSERDFDVTGTKVTGGDSTYNYFHTALGVNAISAKNADIKVYPNPSDGKFTIRWSSISEYSLLKIYNVTAQELLNTELTGNTNQIDLSPQPNGVYFYKVLAENGEVKGEGKIIIQK